MMTDVRACSESYSHHERRRLRHCHYASTTLSHGSPPPPQPPTPVCRCYFSPVPIFGVFLPPLSLMDFALSLLAFGFRRIPVVNARTALARCPPCFACCRGNLQIRRTCRVSERTAQETNLRVLCLYVLCASSYWIFYLMLDQILSPS